jgi:hypothetical protein
VSLESGGVGAYDGATEAAKPLTAGATIPEPDDAWEKKVITVKASALGLEEFLPKAQQVIKALGWKAP